MVSNDEPAHYLDGWPLSYSSYLCASQSKFVQVVTEFQFYFIRETRRDETMTDAEYSDDLTLLSNTPAQTESLLSCLEQETRSPRGVVANVLDCNQSSNSNRAITFFFGLILLGKVWAPLPPAMS